MFTSMKKNICRFLIVSMGMLSIQAANAGMIGTDRLAVVAGAQVERSTVNSFVTRGDIATQLSAMGVDSQNTLDRVAAMTDAEVASLADKLNSVPAGADASGVLVLLILIGVLYLVWKR